MIQILNFDDDDLVQLGIDSFLMNSGFIGASDAVTKKGKSKKPGIP